MRGGRASVLLVALLVALLLASCASAIDHHVPGGPSFADEEVRFVAPAGWVVQPSTSLSYGPSQLRRYLANQPLRADCDANLVCRSPLPDGLKRDGIFVTWIAQPCVARQCELPAARLIAIGNRQGVRVPVIHGCEGTGFTERDAYFVTVTPQRVDILLTCARDPSDTTRSALIGFLDAINWRIP